MTAQSHIRFVSCVVVVEFAVNLKHTLDLPPPQALLGFLISPVFHFTDFDSIVFLVALEVFMTKLLSLLSDSVLQ